MRWLRGRLAWLVMIAGLLGAAAALVAVTAPAASAAPVAGPGWVRTDGPSGWIRIAHLSPEAPAMDMYLYPFGDPGHPVVLRDVRYGAVSDYVAVAPGQYTVAMRGYGAPATSKPALTTSFMVTEGAAFTLAALGPDPGLRTEVLRDQMNAPSGKAVVRVLQASLKQHQVTVSYGTDVLARQLAFGSATAYTTISPSTRTVQFTAPGEQASQPAALGAGSVHTIVVLDNGSGLKVDLVTDAVGSQAKPTGGVQAGFGGMAPIPGPNPAPWLALMAAGGLLAAGGFIQLIRPAHLYEPSGSPLPVVEAARPPAEPPLAESVAAVAESVPEPAAALATVSRAPAAEPFCRSSWSHRTGWY
ncbi:MAG: DUF4397 domain-containing protein [Actinobacteria bacterium]|nr:DUF4397 domain-containing protein [Actinomycetota bacterium]